MYQITVSVRVIIQFSLRIIELLIGYQKMNDLKNTVYSDSGILLSNIKEQATDKHNTVG